MMYMSRRIYEDIISMKEIGIDGIVEDGSQRAFFPNGFSIYIYAEALLNRDCDYDAVKEDYFRHVYGDSWKEVEQYLNEISELFDFAYMEGEKSEDYSKSTYYWPAQESQRGDCKRACTGQGSHESSGSCADRFHAPPAPPRRILRHVCGHDDREGCRK